jgi:hypothetical protein
MDLASSVYLANVDAESPAYGETVPLRVQFKERSETYSPENLLAMVPVQGWVLEPETWYAAVVTTAVRDADGRAIGVTPLIGDLANGATPEGDRGVSFAEGLDRLFTLLDAEGIDRSTVAAATAYRTGNFNDRMIALARAVAAMPRPTAQDLHVLDDFPTFTVLAGQVEMPLFQVGDKPYDDDGYIVWDESGAPVQQDAETIRFSLSIPKGAMPAAGFPVLFYAPGQGGSYLQVVERGPAGVDDDGDGPAKFLAHRGIASVNIEANLTGPRHPNGSTAGVDFFNVQSPVALLDNHRQAAAEYGVLIALLDGLEVPPALVPAVDLGGATHVSFDADNFFQYGHSTGSLITAIALGVHPELGAGLLSGSGGSWLYNLTMKETPAMPVIVAGLLGLYVDDPPEVFDPILQLVAMLWEPIEPMNYADLWALDLAARDAPASVLLVGGITDSYFLPPMIEALAMAARMDVVEPLVDEEILVGLDLVGRGSVAAPASANHSVGSDSVSLFTVQYAAPDGHDGHYVPFDLEGPKYQYSCFLSSALAGVATVPPASTSGLDPCPWD